MSDPSLDPQKLPPRPKVSGEVLAFILSLIWLILLAAAFRMLGLQGRQLADTLGIVVVALAVFLPIALIWLAVLVLRAARDMRDESVCTPPSRGCGAAGFAISKPPAWR